MPAWVFPELEVERAAPDVARVRLAGEWDVTVAPRLRAALDLALDEHRALVVDLAETTFVDSSVLWALIAAGERGRAEAKNVVLRLGSPSVVRSALRVAGILEKLPTSANLDEAVRLALPG